MPFSVGHHSDLYNLPLPTALRRLEQRRNIVIVVHYYVHLSTEALHAYRDRVRAARQVIETYLDTHPKVKVKVIIRGPHVLYEGNRHHAMFGDTFGPVYIRMWKEEFRGLYDRVWFLNYWDMTIAAENMQCHPPESMILETVKVLFGYFCDKEMSH
nr:hypothetical protein BaRGS_006784 [Batillaria attramentaria]